VIEKIPRHDMAPRIGDSACIALPLRAPLQSDHTIRHADKSFVRIMIARRQDLMLTPLRTASER
jgi:hypothetical protein